MYRIMNNYVDWVFGIRSSHNFILYGICGLFYILTFCSFWYAAYFEIFDIFVANFVVLSVNVAYFGICGLFCFTALSPTSTCSPEILHFWRAAWNTEDPDSRSNEKGKTKFYIHGGRWISDDKVLDCWDLGPVWNPHISKPNISLSQLSIDRS